MMTSIEISRNFNINKQTVSSRIRRLGLKSKNFLYDENQILRIVYYFVKDPIVYNENLIRIAKLDYPQLTNLHLSMMLGISETTVESALKSKYLILESKINKL
jgi:hypothetical protein